MEYIWLYSLCQCIISVSVIVVSVRLCMAVSGRNAVADVQARTQGARTQPKSVSCCLRTCLGWVGAVGGAVGVPVTVLLNLRIRQCLYTCITLVCCPMLIRQFTMFLLMLLTLDTHLQLRLADRYSSVITHRRVLCVVMLCWVGSVLSSFGEFIGSDVLDVWRNQILSLEAADQGLHDNWTSSLPQLTPSPPPKYSYERKVIGQNLPYGGFLSKFYVEDMHNLTYAELHSNHWGECAADIILSLEFLVYVHAMMVFMLPLLCLLAIYLDLLCIKPRKTSVSHADPPKRNSRWVCSMALSLSLLVLLCLPIHVTQALLLFTPRTILPAWTHVVATILNQLYSLVPQILFTPPKTKMGQERTTFPLSVPRLPPAIAPSRGKSVHVALCEAVQTAPWFSAKHSIKAKVCPGV